MISRDAVPFIGPQDQQRFERLLTWYATEGGLRAALLVDRTGRLLASVGETAFDATAFATLAAADFAAGDQLALLLGEEEFAALYHQGENRSMYLSDVGGRAILAALFDGRTTLGMVRMKARTIVPELAGIFAELAREDARMRAQLDPGWASDAETEIDRLFAD
ncbi:MAG TPA: roadblock/LC7 domain-containing protein [Longimicrobiales bacterium]